MNYESVILELLQRIQRLELEVNELKQKSSQVADETTEKCMNSSNSYNRLDDEMIKLCYDYGKKLYSGGNSRQLADMIANETGMKKNSAIIYLYAVKSMLEGKEFKRAISAKAMQIYLDKISEEFGTTGLERALSSTDKHIEYRIGCGHNVDSLIKLAEKNRKRL